MLTEKQITKFQALYYNHFGEKISKEEAYDKGEKLVELMRVICRPNNQQKEDNKN